MLQVIPNYTKVKTVLDNISGMTTAFTVRGNTTQMVMYEITHFVNGKIETAWMAEEEFVLDNSGKQEIGFKVQGISEDQKQQEIKGIMDVWALTENNKDGK